MIFVALPDFDKDVKRLLKKYKSIADDLETIKSILAVLPYARPPFSYVIDNLGVKVLVIKIKKIASKSFYGKGVNSGLRIIYTYTLEEGKIIFLELYHKNEKELEDKKRIINYLKCTKI